MPADAAPTCQSQARGGPLPTLSPHLTRLLADLVACNFCFPTFAATHAPGDIVLLNDPALQAHIQAIQATVDTSARIQATMERQVAMQYAAELVKLLAARHEQQLAAMQSHDASPTTPHAPPDGRARAAHDPSPAAAPVTSDRLALERTQVEFRRAIWMLFRTTASPILPVRIVRVTEGTQSPDRPSPDSGTSTPGSTLSDASPSAARPADSIGEGFPSPSSPLRGEVASQSEAGEGLPSPSSPRPAGRGARAAGEGGEGSPLSSSSSPSSPRASRGEVASRSEAGEGLLSPSSPLRGEVASRSEAGEGLPRGEVASRSEAGEGLPSSTTSSNASTTPETSANSSGGSQGGAPLAFASPPDAFTRAARKLARRAERQKRRTPLSNTS